MMEDKTSARLIRPHVSREPALQALVSISITPGLRVSGARPSHSAWAVWRGGLSGLYRGESKRCEYKYGARCLGYTKYLSRLRAILEIALGYPEIPSNLGRLKLSAGSPVICKPKIVKSS
jgi:hypothetical protein